MMMPVSFSQAIAMFALHALWQVPLLAGAAALAMRVGRPQARLAYAIWVATLLLCVLMPVGATVAARRAALEAEREAAVSVTYAGADYTGALPEMRRVPAWQRMLARHLSMRDGVHPFALTLPLRAARAVAGLYLLVALCLGLRVVFAWRRSRRLVAGAAEFATDSDVVLALERRCDALGLAVPPVLACDEVTGPALAGVLRPTLLLPACVVAMSPAELEAVFAHELAHLRRSDLPVHFACSLLLVPVGFHPAALWVAERVRQTREMACDAEAAVQMGSVARYAHALLQVAERTGAGDAGVAGLGLFQSGLGLFNDMGLGLFSNSLELTGGAMEERMRMMMTVKGSGSAAGRAARWAACVTVGGVAALAAAMVQVQPALAQQSQMPVVVAVPKVDAPARVVVMDDADRQPRLLGGEHAQEQFRKARRDLDAAASKATTDDERNRIATARAVLGAAQEQLAGADGPLVRVDVGGLRDFKLDPQLRVMIENLKIDPQVRVQIEKQKVDAEKIRVEVEKHRVEFDRVRDGMNSPAFQARIRVQVEDANKQMAAVKIDQAQIDRLMKDAAQQRASAIVMLRSGEMQRQIAEANSMVARVDVPDVAGAMNSGVMLVPEAPVDAQTKPVKVDSGVMAGNVVSKATPVYPPEAKAAHISGAVLLHVLIDETGKVESLQVVSSPDASLTKSAMEAVQQWKYRPYLLNGNPTPVDTTITVHFSFGG